MKYYRKPYQIFIAVVLVIFGVLLIFAAFIVPPTGVIDPTVLTAFGEMLTFSGSILGLDYHYRSLPQPSRKEGAGK